MGSSSVEACCEAPEVFELVEAAFDPIAVFVEVGVVRDRDLARRERWDDGEHAGIGDELAKVVAVVGFVSKQPDDTACGCNQCWGHDDIVGVAGAQEQHPWPPLGIGQGVDFGCPSTARAADGLLERPPFAPAAERCTLIDELSMATVPMMPLDPVSRSNISNQMPCRLHRLKRL